METKILEPDGLVNDKKFKLLNSYRTFKPKCDAYFEMILYFPIFSITCSIKSSCFYIGTYPKQYCPWIDTQVHC